MVNVCFLKMGSCKPFAKIFGVNIYNSSFFEDNSTLRAEHKGFALWVVRVLLSTIVVRRPVTTFMGRWTIMGPGLSTLWVTNRLFG